MDDADEKEEDTRECALSRRTLQIQVERGSRSVLKVL